MLLSPIEAMRLALEQAAQVTAKSVRPNPRVGAVLSFPNGKIMKSFHRGSGQAHAEAALIEKALLQKIDLSEAILYVSLEPCCHFGKRPPCTDAILKSGIKKVFCASLDPDPRVSGQGVDLLKKAGIEVDVGLLEKEARSMNKTWLHAKENQRPFTTLKWAMSSDGFFYDRKKNSKWISGNAAREDLHLFRNKVDAVVTSRVTLEEDRPRFSVRIPGQDEKFLKTFVVGRKKSCRVEDFSENPSMNYHEIQEKDEFLVFLKKIHEQDSIFHLLIEAGPKLCSLILEWGLADEILVYQNTRFISFQDLENPGHLALQSGTLPGLEYKLQELKQLSDSDFKYFLSQN